MVRQDKCIELVELLDTDSSMSNITDFVRGMLYKCYSVLNASDLYSMSFEHYIDNTKKVKCDLRYDDIKSLGIELPSLYMYSYEAYLTYTQQRVWSLVIVANFPIASDLVPINPSYDLPLVKGYDLQTIYDVSYNKVKSCLQFGVGVFPYSLPEVTCQISSSNLPDATQRYFDTLYNKVISSAQRSFQMETSTEFCFEEND